MLVEKALAKRFTATSMWRHDGIAVSDCMYGGRSRQSESAADELGYTQSAVSQAVKALERELGTTLIERGKQGVSLTRDGKQYLPFCARL